MSDIYDLLKALSRNEEAKKLFREARKPSSIEEVAGLYAGIAEKTGSSISKDDILEFLKEKEASQRAQSAEAEGTVKKALDEEALNAVAGGGDYVKHNTACDTTYDKGEWCWISDSCAWAISYYDEGVGAPINTKPWTEEDEEALRRDFDDGDYASSFDSYRDSDASDFCSALS